MNTINRLSSTDTIALGDLLALWVTNNGDTRKVSMSTLVDFIKAQGGESGITALSTLNELRQIDTNDVNVLSQYLVMGADAIDDGKGGVYYWDALSVAVDDNFTVVDSDQPGDGRWLRLNTSSFLIVEDFAELDGLTKIGTSSPDVAYNKDDGLFYEYVGSAWVANYGTYVYRVDTVSDLTAALGAKFSTVIVNEEERGGTFIYRGTGVNDNGTIFNGWHREDKSPISVLWFGAYKDGTNEAATTIAIQTALDNTPEGGECFIPEGDYAISGLILPEKVIHIYGEGSGLDIGSRLLVSGTRGIDTRSIVYTPSFYTPNNRNSSIKRLAIDSSATTNEGIFVSNLGMIIEEVYIRGGKNGLVLEDSVSGKYSYVWAYDQEETSCKLIPRNTDPSQTCNANMFTNLNLSATGVNGIGLDVQGTSAARGNTFENLDSEQNGQYGLSSDGLQNVYINLWTERNTGTIDVLDNDSSQSIFINPYYTDTFDVGMLSIVLRGSDSSIGQNILIGGHDRFTDVVADYTGRLKIFSDSGNGGVFIMDDDGSTFDADSGSSGVNYLGRVGASLRGNLGRSTALKTNAVDGDYEGKLVDYVSDSVGTLTRLRELTHKGSYFGGAIYNNTREKSDTVVISGSGSVDLGHTEVTDNYGRCIVTIELTGCGTSGANAYLVAKRQVAFSGGVPAFNLIGTDVTVGCTVAFAADGANKFKITVTDTTTQTLNGAYNVRIVGGGGGDGTSGGII